jgi:SM-20-related protein
MLPRATYVEQVEGSRISVFDGLVGPADLAALHRTLQGAGYARSEFARPETEEHRHWAAELPLGQLPTFPLTPPTLAAVAVHTGGQAYEPFRSYVNVALYGDMLYSHVDCAPGVGELTALWYVCERWDHEWGGETVFFDSRNDVRAAVSPKPGRLAVFDGEVRHAGRAPNRICHATRFTLAIKFKRAGR